MDNETRELHAALDALHLRLSDAHGQALIAGQRIARGPGGREVALVITKIEEALLWASKIEAPFAR